ncbi:hypothetical protein ABPG72_006718 [Tetrahymena utriculariae]
MMKQDSFYNNQLYSNNNNQKMQGNWPPASNKPGGNDKVIKKSEGISINNFTLLKMIGEGAYAKVYLVRKLDNQKVYALKILKKKKIQELGQQHRVILEKDILANIESHPFIIKLHYSFQNDTKLFFALDFCPGGELFSILSRKHKFDEEQCRFYASQIVLAIEHLHKHNIIYRDLKPENVILDKEGYIRISDFGLSKDNIEEQTAFSVCGTPEYLAPEILNNSGHGKPVDWWALGNLIYEMLTGLPPFYVENNREELFKKIKYTEITIPSYFSKPCKDLLTRLFLKNPYQRLGSNGAEEIKDHPWFTDVDWDKMLQKKYNAPFVPKLKNETDVSNFDDYFVHQPLNESYQDNQIYHEFSNFSFVNSLKEQNQNKMDIE